MSVKLFRIMIFFSMLLLTSPLMLFNGYVAAENTVDIGDGSSSFFKISMKDLS